MPTLDPPVPVSAVWDRGPERLTVTFSHAILDSPIPTPANWTMRFDAFRWSALSAGVLAGVLVLDMVEGDPDAGPNNCTFTPPPFDIISNTVRQIPAPAFADFPVTEP